MKDIAPLCNSSLALSEDSRLPPNLIKSADDFFAAVYETIKRIRDPDLGAKFLHQLLRSAKVVSWHPREKVMNCLKLQATMEEIEPLWAVDIHGCAQHLLRE